MSKSKLQNYWIPDYVASLALTAVLKKLNRLVRAQELYAPTNRAPYTVAYAYDHHGRMVSKRIYDSALKTLALPNHPTT